MVNVVMIQGSKQLLIRRIAVYICGNFLIALGVSFAVKADLGVSPVISVPYILSGITKTDQGLVTALVYSCYVLVQWPLLRGKFRMIDLLQIAIAFLFGYFVTFCRNLLVFENPVFYPLRLLLLCLSVVLIALGILLYITANFIPQPPEGLCLAIEKVSGWKYHNIKTAFDCSSVALSALTAFIVLGTVFGLREGTFIAMIGIGRTLGVLSKLLKQPLVRFCFAEERKTLPVDRG